MKTLVLKVKKGIKNMHSIFKSLAIGAAYALSK